MQNFNSRVAALVLLCTAGLAHAHGDPATHGHDSVASQLAGSLVAALFAGAALRLAWLAVAALRRRRAAARGQE